MEHLLFKAAVTAATDKGEFTAVISTATIDREKDIVDPAGFVRALHKWVPLGKKVPLAWNHSTRPDDQIGFIDPATVRVKGNEVVASGKIDLDTPNGAHAWRCVKAGTLGFSFGYLVPTGGATKRAGGGRHITELDVFEVTATPTPMNGDTRVLDFKGLKGHADVGPHARDKLKYLIRYYMSKPHPFTECFTADTPVDAPRDMEQHPEGIRIDSLRKGDLVWSFDEEEREFKLKPVVWAEVTRRDAELIAVTLDNGKRIRCTPDHPFLLRNGRWMDGGKLRPGDSLMPLYRDFEPRIRMRPDRPRFESEHKIVAEAAYGSLEGLHVHHADRRRANVSLENLEALTGSEHSAAHHRQWDDAVALRNESWRCVGCDQLYTPTAYNQKRCGPCQELQGYQKLIVGKKSICAVCGGEYVVRAPNQRYCKKLCRHRAKDRGIALPGKVGGQPNLATWNHKVVRVEPLSEREDVWDIEVMDTHTFVVHGVVVHNCVHDNAQRFGPDGADKVCATLKDVGLGTTHWRNQHGKALANLPDPVSDEPTDMDLEDMSDQLLEACDGNLDGLMAMWLEHMHNNGDGPTAPGKALDPDELRAEANKLSREFSVRGARKQTDPTGDEGGEDEDDPAELLGGMISQAQDFIDDEDDPNDVAVMRQIMTLLLRLQSDEATEPPDDPSKALAKIGQLENELSAARKQLENIDTLRRAGEALTLDAVKATRKRRGKHPEAPAGADWVIPETELAGAKSGELKATWTTAYVNSLPDSCFLFIEPGGSKDSDGKTMPRSLRHFPYKDASGAVDQPHLRNALARIPQSNLSQDIKDKLTARAQNILDSQKALVVDPDVAVDVTDRGSQTRSVDPLVQQAKAIALAWHGHGVSRQSPQPEPQPSRPEYDEDVLRREMRDLMFTSLRN